jgi:hypothetical protein
MIGLLTWPCMPSVQTLISCLKSHRKLIYLDNLQTISFIVHWRGKQERLRNQRNIVVHYQEAHLWQITPWHVSSPSASRHQKKGWRSSFGVEQRPLAQADGNEIIPPAAASLALAGWNKFPQYGPTNWSALHKYCCFCYCYHWSYPTTNARSIEESDTTSAIDKVCLACARPLIANGSFFAHGEPGLDWNIRTRSWDIHSSAMVLGYVLRACLSYQVCWHVEDWHAMTS